MPLGVLGACRQAPHTFKKPRGGRPCPGGREAEPARLALAHNHAAAGRTLAALRQFGATCTRVNCGPTEGLALGPAVAAAVEDRAEVLSTQLCCARRGHCMRAR